MEEWQVDIHTNTAISIFFTYAATRKEAKSNIVAKVPEIAEGACKITASKTSSYKLPFHIRIRR